MLLSGIVDVCWCIQYVCAHCFFTACLTLIIGKQSNGKLYQAMKQRKIMNTNFFSLFYLIYKKLTILTSKRSNRFGLFKSNRNSRISNKRETFGVIASNSRVNELRYVLPIRLDVCNWRWKKSRRLVVISAWDTQRNNFWEKSDNFLPTRNWSVWFAPF